MDAADPRSAALDRDATAHRGASIPVTGGNRGHGGVAKHSGPRGNSWTATGRGCVGCGASSSGTSVPAKGRLKDRRSGGIPRSSDTHWSDGNVGGDPRRSTVFRRSARGPPIRRGQLPFGVLRNALCPKAYPGSIRHGDENGSPLPYRRSSGHVGQSVVEDVPRRSEVVDPAKEIGFLQPSGPGNPCQRCPIQNMLGVWPARDLGALI